MADSERLTVPNKYHEIVPLLITAGQRLYSYYSVVDADIDYRSDPLEAKRIAIAEQKRQQQEQNT